MSKIGIIGCGWLGKPLALHLIHKHKVQCYSRKIQADTDVEYSVNPSFEHPFWTNEIFIISIATKDNYLQTLKDIVQNCPSGASIILMSSTSVYKEFDTEVDEDIIITQAGLQKQAEDLLLGLRKKVLVLRLGGLMGDDRISGRWKSISAFTDGPVNYIHQDDVINIIHKMIEADIDQGIFNLVSPEHPLRSEVHKINSLKFGFELGSFTGTSQRIVTSDKLVKTLDYSFLYPDPLEFWTSL